MVDLLCGNTSAKCLLNVAYSATNPYEAGSQLVVRAQDSQSNQILARPTKLLLSRRIGIGSRIILK
jgi:hypothetical protein